jgi:hypothetical protein
VDFTDPANAQQIAFYLPRQGRSGITWSSYWYNGFVYANNLSTGGASRGLDVFTVEDPALASAIQVPRLNPQTQERPAGVAD